MEIEYQKPNQKQRSILETKKNIKSLEWNSNGNLLIAADSNIRLYNIEQGQPKKQSELKVSNEQIEIIKNHNDIIAISSKDWIKLYDIRSKNLIRTEKKQDIQSINWNTADPNYLNFVYKSSKETLLQILDLRSSEELLWNPNQGKERDSERVHLFEVKEAIWDQSNQIFFVVGGLDNNGIIQMYDSHRKNLLEEFSPQKGMITSIKQRQHLLATGGSDGIVLLWNLYEMIPYMNYPFFENEIKNIDFSFDSKLFSVSSCEDQLLVFSTEKQTNHYVDYLKGECIQFVKWHPNKNILAYVGYDKGKGDSSLNLYGQ